MLKQTSSWQEIGQPPARILVVEDSPIVREFVAETLMSCGYQVEAAENGWDGLERFKDGIFDLVITDQEMPAMDGLRLAESIKALAPDVPVVMFSGARPRGVFSAAVDFFMAKPFSMSQLREIVRIMLWMQVPRQPMLAIQHVGVTAAGSRPS